MTDRKVIIGKTGKGTTELVATDKEIHTATYLHLIHYPTINHLRKKIKRCEGSSHVQQVVYSTYHDGLTQVCYNCQTVRTTIDLGK